MCGGTAVTGVGGVGRRVGRGEGQGDVFHGVFARVVRVIVGTADRDHGGVRRRRVGEQRCPRGEVRVQAAQLVRRQRVRGSVCVDVRRAEDATGDVGGHAAVHRDQRTFHSELRQLRQFGGERRVVHDVPHAADVLDW